MAELLDRGLRARPSLLDQAQVTAPVSVDPVGGASQMERGLRSSLAAQSASSLATEGLKAEIAGQNELAAEKYRQAQQAKALAAATAPRVTSLRDVGSFDDAMDFAAGGLPQVLTTTVPTLAGAAIGRGLGGRIGMAAGGMVPAYNMESEETIGELATDPQTRGRMSAEDILNTGRAKGAINSALEVAGPAYLIERAIGKAGKREGLRGAAKTVGMGALLEGPGTELPQEVVGQAAKSFARTGDFTQQVDPWALADATALGALGGGTLATPAAGIQLAREAVQAGAEKAGPVAEKAAELGGEAAQVVTEKGGIVLDAAKEKAEPIMSRIKSNVGTAYDAGKMDWLVAKNENIPDEIAGDAEAVMAHIAAQDGERKKYVRDYLTNIVNTAEDPARVEQASELLNNLDDPETYRGAAAGIVGMEKTKQFQKRVETFMEDAKDFGKGLMDGPKKKSNAQGAFGADKLDPTNQLITQSLVDALPPEAADAGAEQLIPFFRGVFSGKVAPQLTPRIMRDFIGVYGDDAVNVAAQISQHITRDSEGRGLDPQATVRALQDFMADEEVRAQTRQQAVADAMTNEARVRMQTELGRPVTPDDIDVVSDMMTRFTEGSLSKQVAPRVEAELKKLLGDKFVHTKNIFRAMHDAAARKSAPLVHAQDMADAEETVDSGADALDFDERSQADSFGTMMEGKDREFSLAKKADENGVAPFFDSREEAQARWDEKIAPIHVGKTGAVIRADEYAVLTGSDPLKLATQYDKKFAAEPADFKQKAALAKEAMTLLRNKFAIQMDVVTNEDADNLSDKELEGVLARSGMPVVKKEQMQKGSDRRYVDIGDGNVRDTKPTVDDGYLFVGTPGGKHRAVKMSALLFAMKGKQKRGDLSGPDEGAEGTLNAALAGIARLGDTGKLDLAQGVFGYDTKGQQRWFVRPNGDNQKGLSKLRVSKDQTLGDVTSEVAKTRKREVARETDAAAERAAEVIADKLKDGKDIVKAIRIGMEKKIAEARQKLYEAKSVSEKASARRAVNDAVLTLRNFNKRPAAYVAEEWKKASEWKRGADRLGQTDTDPVLNAANDTRGMQEDDANFADVQRRTREQSRYSGKARREAKAEPKPEPMPAVDAQRLGLNANKTLAYLNNPPKDYTPEKAVAAKEWAQRWLTRTAGMTTPEVEDLRATLAVVDKVASQMIEGDKAVSKMEGKPRKKANAASAERTGKVASDKEVADAKAYVKKVLGKNIKLTFEQDLGGLSGEWEESAAKNIIRIALNAGPGVLSVAHHEAMHEFFSRISGEARTVLLSAANSPTVVRKLARLLDGETAALAQIKTDPEERLAYMYQFWAAGKLAVGPDTQTFFQKIAKFFRKVAGMISNDERAAAIMAAFHEGKMSEPSAVANVLGEIMDEGAAALKARKALKPLYDKAYGFVMPSSDVLADSDNPFAQQLGKLMFTNLVGENDGKIGYMNAVRAKTGEWDNRFGAILEGMDDEEVALLREVMSAGKQTTFAPVRKASAELRTLLKDFRDYMVDRGVDIGNRKDYFPRVWDFEKIASNKEAFVEMLTTKYPDKVTPELADQISNKMTMLSGVEQHGDLNEAKDSAGYTPYMQAVNALKLDFIKDEDAQEFLEQDLIKIMTGYLKQGVRRAEYESRFGERGGKLEELLIQAHDYEVERIKRENPDLDGEEVLAQAAARSKQYTDAAHAMEGTIGYDKIGPEMRKFTSWMIAYQSFRLLPFTLFSSMIDPLGMVVRGGDVNTALEAYKRGVKEVIGQWRGKETRDGMTKTAELLGVIEHQSFLDSLGYVHESVYMDSKAKKLTDKFFQWNGMEAWNRAMRTQATAAALDFIKEHATDPTEHSDRWLKELGLKRSDVRTQNGELVLWKEDFEALGMDKVAAAKAAEKMQMAVNQWVDGSMLRPNAALRPSWSSDPRFALLFYLKQFTYAFQKTFLARVRNEFRHGNTAPLVAMLPFVPVMIASDITRGLVQNGGELPDYMKSWDVGDYLVHGVQRAGLTGIAQFGIDEAVHPTDILGPVVGQGVDLFTKPLDKNIAEAIPGVSVLN